MIYKLSNSINFLTNISPLKTWQHFLTTPTQCFHHLSFFFSSVVCSRPDAILVKKLSLNKQNLNLCSSLKLWWPKPNGKWLRDDLLLFYFIRQFKNFCSIFNVLSLTSQEKHGNFWVEKAFKNLLGFILKATFIFIRECGCHYSA